MALYELDGKSPQLAEGAWVAEGAAPARACVEAKLYDPRVLVEMMVVAAQA